MCSGTLPLVSGCLPPVSGCLPLVLGSLPLQWQVAWHQSTGVFLLCVSRMFRRMTVVQLTHSITNWSYKRRNSRVSDQFNFQSGDIIGSDTWNITKNLSSSTILNIFQFWWETQTDIVQVYTSKLFFVQISFRSHLKVGLWKLLKIENGPLNDQFSL